MKETLARNIFSYSTLIIIKKESTLSIIDAIFLNCTIDNLLSQGGVLLSENSYVYILNSLFEKIQS